MSLSKVSWSLLIKPIFIAEMLLLAVAHCDVGICDADVSLVLLEGVLHGVPSISFVSHDLFQVYLEKFLFQGPDDQIGLVDRILDVVHYFFSQFSLALWQVFSQLATKVGFSLSIINGLLSFWVISNPFIDKKLFKRHKLHNWLTQFAMYI